MKVQATIEVRFDTDDYRIYVYRSIGRIRLLDISVSAFRAEAILDIQVDPVDLDDFWTTVEIKGYRMDLNVSGETSSCALYFISEDGKNDYKSFIELNSHFIDNLK